MQKVWKICLEIFSKDKNIFLEREKESGGGLRILRNPSTMQIDVCRAKE
jgi:hypothetical protein